MKTTTMMPTPTLQQAEKAVGHAAQWAGRCYEIACALVEEKLTDGVAVYGHWLGPVAEGSMFYRKGAPGFVQHGWVLLPDGRVLDPTRWVFEDVQPYLYVGPQDHYDEGGNEWREAMSSGAPAFDSSAKIVHFKKRVPDLTWDYLEELFGLQNRRKLGALRAGALTMPQVFWLANRSPARLGPHARPIYEALFAIGNGAFIPHDNRCKVERECGVTFVEPELEDS